MNLPLQTPFQNLSTLAVIFCTLSLLFGIYVVLFVIAVWSTYRHQGLAYRRLRTVTVALFLVLCAHYTVRALIFSRARTENPPQNEEAQWTAPLLFIGAVTSTLTGLISDGFLAWRLYVIYGRMKLALYLPAAAVVITALLGLSGDLLATPWNVELYNTRFAMKSLEVDAAWGWCIFGVNTLLTGFIIGRIMYLSRGARACDTRSGRRGRYNTTLEAIIESALVTWVGLLLYEISTFAPTGHVSGRFDIGYIMVCIMPIFFGISQCLITARLAIHARNDTDSTGRQDLGSPGSLSTDATPSSSRRPVMFCVPDDVDAESGSVDSASTVEKKTQMVE